MPLALAVATTRAAMQRPPSLRRAVSVSVSASITLLFQRELSAMFLAKVKLAAGAAMAAGAAVVLIGMTLAGALGRGAQGIEPRSHQAPTSEAKATIVPKAEGGIPEVESAADSAGEAGKPRPWRAPSVLVSARSGKTWSGAIRARRSVPQGAATARRRLARRPRPMPANRSHQLWLHPGSAVGRREARLTDGSQGARVPPRFRPR